MDISIKDLITENAEYILSHESIASFAHVVRRPSHFDDTFDIDLTVAGISITSRSIALDLPSGSFEFFPISSDTYYKIEVM